MSDAVLDIRNIAKSYVDGSETRKILDHAGLSLVEGEFAAIVGPSGCGKSTFLTIAGMLLSPDEGEVYIKGRNVSSLRRSEWTKIRRNQIGFIFQDHQLLPYLKGKEQLSVIPSVNPHIHDMIDDLDLGPVMNKYPSKMSGGEKQRVAILRAFANNPDLILADEPTASLDEERSERVVSMIQKEVKKYRKAALMVTHDERVLKYVDTVYRMDHGRLVKQD